mmetsp:Transcript_13638/g.20197  ORF Transcript_13638/g.20197 Transcript_13638/m.20197 type:complete len:260 (-) Transcript_13638:85-864(-)
MARARLLHHKRQARRCSFQCDIAKGFHSRRKQKYIRRCICHCQLISIQPSYTGRVWQALHNILAWSGANDERTEGHVLLVQALNDACKYIGALFSDQPSAEANDRCVWISYAKSGRAEFGASMDRRESVQVNAATPYPQLRDSVKLVGVCEVCAHVGRSAVQGLQIIVGVAKVLPQNVLQPSEARIVIEVLGQVAVVRAHEWYFLSACVLHEVEGRAVRHSHVDDAGAKVLDLLFDFGRQGKPNLVSVLEGNGDGVVHK